MKRIVFFLWGMLVVFLVGYIVRNGWLYAQYSAMLAEGERYREALLEPISVPPNPTDMISEPVRILFGGDVMWDRDIRTVGEREGYDYILNPITDLLQSADLVVTNLEGPVTDNESISKGSEIGSTANYIFTFDPAVLETMVRHQMMVVNLGNNHIGNFGPSGIASSAAFLETTGIAWFGKLSPEEPARTTSVRLGDMQVLFVNYNQFVPMDIQEAVSQIHRGTVTHDLVIVYTHWGNEYEPEARPVTVDAAHAFIDAGADVVIGSHPHVVQNMEEYNGKRIYYSLGNMVFDQYFSEDVRNGLLVEMVVEPESLDVQYVEHPIRLEMNGQVTLN